MMGASFPPPPGSPAGGGAPSPLVRLQRSSTNVYRWYQFYVDKSTPHPGARWTIFGILLALFLVRILSSQGFYVIAYALGIYLLNIFLLFLSPRFDPAHEEDEAGLANDAAAPPSSIFLPVRADDEFRPFVRRLPEFRFWYNAVRATAAALLGTLLPFLDVPVFWPILLFYFVLLTVLTLRRQITHMVRYKYVPFDWGKKSYAGGASR